MRLLKMKKIVYLEVSGCFGSQLLALMCAELLRKKGVSVWEDFSYFNTKNKAPDGVYFCKLMHPLQNSFLFKLKSSIYFNAIFRRIARGPIFCKAFSVFSDKNELKISYILKNINFLEGLYYYKYLLNLISSQNILCKTKEEDCIVHIRRGDYKIANLNMLSLECVKILIEKKFYKNDVFTISDDMADIKQIVSTYKWKDASSDDFLKDLAFAALFKKIVLSQSQFSLIILLLKFKNASIFIPSVWRPLIPFQELKKYDIFFHDC